MKRTVKTPRGKYSRNNMQLPQMIVHGIMFFLSFQHLKGIRNIKHYEQNLQTEQETVYTTNVGYNLGYNNTTIR